METMKDSGLWSNLGTHGCFWWLYGGYVFPEVKRPENFNFWSQIWPWRWRSIATQNNRDINQAILHLEWVMSYGADKLKMGLILPFKLNLTLKVNINTPPSPHSPLNKRDLNQGLLHLWSKIGDPSLNGSQVIARTSKWLIHTHGQTDRHRQPQKQQKCIWKCHLRNCVCFVSASMC